MSTFSGSHKTGYIRVAIGKSKETICPVCDQRNNHVATMGNCEHLVKVVLGRGVTGSLAYYKDTNK